MRAIAAVTALPASGFNEAQACSALRASTPQLGALPASHFSSYECDAILLGQCIQLVEGSLQIVKLLAGVG